MSGSGVTQGSGFSVRGGMSLTYIGARQGGCSQLLSFAFFPGGRRSGAKVSVADTPPGWRFGV